ncbi:MAG: translation initiation factor IF-2 [Bacteroidetes bacterium]|nr:translation initiation factor IF-2 [Bacteroidota bacterium]
MTDKQNTYRIVKVATEFGVAVGTLADHLKNKGFEVDAKPTAKITQEQYEVLLRDFRSDKAARDEAKQLDINKGREDNSTTEISDVPKKPASNETNEFDDELILIKNNTVNPVTTPTEEKSVENVKKLEEKPVVEKEKKEEKVEKPAIEEKPAAKKEEGEGKVGVKVVGKIELRDSDKKGTKKKEEEPVKAKEEKPAEKKEEAKPEKVEKPAEKPVAKKEEKEEKPKVEEKPVARKEVEKPAAKKEEKAKPEEKPKLEPKAKIEKPKDSKTEGEDKSVVKPNYEKLQGLKVLGKIELPTEQKKKPVASSDGSHEGKKKRKRKTIPGSGPNTQNRDNRGNNNRPGGNNNRPGGGNNNRPGGGNRDNRTGNDRQEITEKQIQDKLKQTLARIQPSGKSGGNRQKTRREKRDQHAKNREEQMRLEEMEQKILKVTEFISANELAKMMDVGVNEVITACFSLGMMVSINQRLDAEMISIIAEEFGYEVEFVGADVQEAIEEEVDDPEDLQPRAPIVTVMGHVDHGKTSLLDYVRKTNVIAGEAGGITQHMGAYEVTLDSGKKITFLDTPGHEAFTAMRARGAKMTDVAIIVIAADDDVMPQTKEAIAHAQAAAVPMVFAINKIDKDGANPDRVKEQLAQMDILVEDWGGKFQCQEISAKKGINIDELLEKVLLEAEMLDLKANPDKRASGSIVEAQLDKGRGIVTTVMVQGGTLRIGDPIIAGTHAGKVRAMFNERGRKIDEAGPSTPVTLLGFSGAPQAGDRFVATASDQEARDIANKRQQLQREQGLRTQKHITLDEIGRRLAIGNFKELNIIVKGDVDGSVEALADSLLKLSTEEIQINVIQKAVGQISETDVMLASASDAIIVGFQVRPSSQAKKLAENEGIEIKYYSVIYKAIEEIKDAMEGLLEPDIEEKEVCNIEVRDVFKITKVGTIAGCYVLDGKITRNTRVRLVRDGVVIHTGELDSLKRFKDDVKEVSAGYECGLGLKNYNDIQVGDIIEGFEEFEVKRKLK